MPHFVEIAAKPLLKTAFPNQTTFFSTYHKFEGHDPASGSYSVSARTFPLLWRTLNRHDVTLVLCEPTMFAPWAPRWIVRAIFDRRLLKGHCPLVRTWGPQLLRWRRPAPLVIVDQDDLPLINRHNLWLLRRASLYFKRELPVDHWRLFMKTAHNNLPTIRFRKRESFVELIRKIRPISLGLPHAFVDDPLRRGRPKEVDVFFAGQVEHSSTIRQTGIAELRKLAELGIKVDVPGRRLPADEFRDRMSRAWLTWSPEGLGWDCFRHYEALACGAIPVINSPVIERYQPLCEGVHAFYYAAEHGYLTQSILAALANKSRLQRMSVDGYQHVVRHHTQTAIATHIVREALAANRKADDQQQLESCELPVSEDSRSAA